MDGIIFQYKKAKMHVLQCPKYLKLYRSMAQSCQNILFHALIKLRFWAAIHFKDFEHSAVLMTITGKGFMKL